jgi:hypothetical protein
MSDLAAVHGWACYKHGIRGGRLLNPCCADAVDLTTPNGQRIEERLCREEMDDERREAERREL